MSKRDTSHFQVAQAGSPDVAPSLSALLDNLKIKKLKPKNRFEKWVEQFLDFIWRLTDPDR
jgi:hypothetical protein